MLSLTKFSRSSVILIVCFALLSTTFARVLPKVKRDNVTLPCCAYRITNRGDAMFRYQHVMEFDKLASMDQLFQSGWTVSHAQQIGGANTATGQKCISNENNVKLIPGVGLTLTVPGGQSVDAVQFSGASITFPEIALGGMWQVEAQVSNVPGAIYNTFTIHGDPWRTPLGWQDEQDLVVYTSSLLTKTQYRPAAGLQMNNFDPATRKMSWTISPFSSDPSQGIHTYSLNWVPTLTCPVDVHPGRITEYRFDGAPLNAPTESSSIHPSRFTLALSTNGERGASAGPPLSDVVVTIKSVRAYYDKPNSSNACPTKNDFECTPAMACEVAV